MDKKMKRISIKWRMTIYSTISIFIIFMLCNVLQLILIHTLTTNQEEDQLTKRSKEISTLIKEQSKRKDIKTALSEDFFENILGENEMIRILDDQGQELLNISEDFPDLENRNTEFGFRRIKEDNEGFLMLTKPLIVGSFKGSLEIGQSVETFDEFMESVFWVLIVGTILSLLLSSIGGQLLARKLLVPLAIMTNTMRKIEDKHFQERMPVLESNDEFSQLSSIFNSMMDRIEASMEQQRRFVEDASHELRTPLAVIHGHLSLLQRWGKNDEEVLENSLQTSIKETNRLIELTNRLLTLTRMDKQVDQKSIIACDATEIMNEVIHDYELIYGQLKITVDMTKANRLLAIPQEQLKQVLIILLDNAIKYSGEKKKIAIRSSNHEHNYKIEIEDNGYGISQEDLPFIFDRFYRADKARSREEGGTGLGLSIAKDILTKNKGNISAASKLGVGTIITLEIPYTN